MVLAAKPTSGSGLRRFRSIGVGTGIKSHGSSYVWHRRFTRGFHLSFVVRIHEIVSVIHTLKPRDFLKKKFLSLVQAV